MIVLKSILGLTQPNWQIAPKLLGLPVAVDNTVSALSRDRICEFAARICYASESKIGQAPKFVEECINRGHDDVIEHFWITAEFMIEPFADKYQILYSIQKNFPWVRMENMLMPDGYTSVIMSANGRVWRGLIDFFYNEYSYTVGSKLLKNVAYQALGGDIESFSRHANLSQFVTTINQQEQITNEGQIINLLGAMPKIDGTDFGAATFYVQNISRAAANQFVRHRLLSFSQESQRYVDIEKGENSIMVPESIANVEFLSDMFLEHWTTTQELYRELRVAGIKKEDARAVLPQSTSTRLVVTGSCEGWKHFFKLRLHKSAQNEIRHMAEVMYEMSKPYLDIRL